MKIKELPSGLVVPDTPKPPPVAQDRIGGLRSGEYVVIVNGYDRNLLSCIRAVFAIGGRLKSVTAMEPTVGSLMGARWLVVYEAKQPASWEELC